MINSVIISIIKYKSGDFTDKNNYRPIALSSIISKIFKHTIKICLEEYLFILILYISKVFIISELLFEYYYWNILLYLVLKNIYGQTTINLDLKLDIQPTYVSMY